MNKTRLIIRIVVLSILFLLIYVRELHVPEGVLKKAVKKNEVTSENYIMCKWARTTGFDWYIVKDEEGNETYELCNITGVDPISELNLRYDFMIADNTYVFYVDEVEEIYSEASKEMTKLYHVTDWDILYPVKHGTISDVFDSKRYIYSQDTSKPQ